MGLQSACCRAVTISVVALPSLTGALTYNRNAFHTLVHLQRPFEPCGLDGQLVRGADATAVPMRAHAVQHTAALDWHPIKDFVEYI